MICLLFLMCVVTCSFLVSKKMDNNLLTYMLLTSNFLVLNYTIIAKTVKDIFKLIIFIKINKYNIKYT